MKWTGNDTYNAVMSGDCQSYGLPTLICVTCTESRVAKVDGHWRPESKKAKDFASAFFAFANLTDCTLLCR